MIFEYIENDGLQARKRKAPSDVFRYLEEIDRYLSENTGIACKVDWKQSGYKDARTARSTLNMSIKRYNFGLEVHAVGDNLYIFKK